MERYKPFLFFMLFPFFIFSDTIVVMSHGQLLPIVDDQGGNPSLMQIYIVHVVKPEGTELLNDEELESWHKSFMPNTTLDSGEPRLVYSYRHVISGFAARLTPEEVKAMEAMDGFLYARPEQVHPLDTTYTPNFLWLSQLNGTWTQTFQGEGIIIGVLDSGIPRNHPSFGDNGMPPPPIRWKGSCNFTGFCNNKIIGAANFSGGKKSKWSPIDTGGHGSHVASIAAGNFVNDAEVLGMAKGIASGMAPKAHLAIYKVCGGRGCGGSNILAGGDQAIKDGVDVITMSIGDTPNTKFYNDDVALVSLSAVQKGISACASAGNKGSINSLSHSAPWVLTVGASTTDRRIRSLVKLGNGVILDGQSAYQPISFNSSTLLPLIYPGISGSTGGMFCNNGSLNNINVRGKIVLCLEGGNNSGKVVWEAGGAGMIIMSSKGFATDVTAHVLPASHVNFLDGRKAKLYASSSKTPTATIIFKGTEFDFQPSPAVAQFSSRGPSTSNGGILKPDILAPGVNILGAWPYQVGPNPSGLSSSTFNFDSGTSMAAPHVAGIVALIKNKHPNWSPAAIQSAIVTSADELDLRRRPITDERTNSTADIFAVGAGQVRASRAIDPGLVYDLNTDDYIGYLCGLGYNDSEVTKTMGASKLINCSTVTKINASDLNYPSITVSLKANSPLVTVTRTVTNVGQANSIYQARIIQPAGVDMYLSSYDLTFSRLQQQKSFNVTLRKIGSGPGKPTSWGKLEWISANYVVKSPIAVVF